jgi:hypothetical protein
MECPVCLNEMDEPKLLHCGHNLCADCPGRMWKRRVVRTNSCRLSSKTQVPVANKHIVCPMYKAVTEIAGDAVLVTNFGMKGGWTNDGNTYLIQCN